MAASNKEIAEEAKLIAEDETNRRTAMEGKFSSTLTEINEKQNESDQSVKDLIDENLDL
jgi:hypothetical protein